MTTRHDDSFCFVRVAFSRSHTHTLCQCFRTILGFSSLSVNYPDIENVHPLLPWLGPLFRKCVIKDTALESALCDVTG